MTNLRDTQAQKTSRASTDKPASIMELRGIYKSFGPVEALKGVDLVIRPGEVHAIVGENGAGKSTLISIASGVLQADAGSVIFDGREVTSPNARQLREAGISVTFQHPALAPDLTVLENLQLVSPELARGGGSAKAEKLLRQVATDQLSMPMNRRVAELNLAQLHVVEVMRALANRPKVLFFDEPTEPLQEADIRKLFDMIKALRAEGTAVVYVSHRLHEVDELADRISVMRDGEIVESRLADSITGDEIVTLIAGRPLGQVFPDKSKGAGGAILEVRGLSGQGFENVDFVACAGEIVGVTGVEGEGQREFIRAVAGLQRRTAGEIRLNGHTVRGESASMARRAGIGFVTDDRHAEGLFPTLSLRENLGIGVIGQNSRFGVIDRSREVTASDAIVERLSVRAASIESPISDLSGGNQQKVLIGRELAANPTVLLVDEPTKGVDVGARSEIYQRLRSLADQGVAVVVCSSDGIEHEGLCDRVAIFARGHIVEELTGDDVTDTSITEANLTTTVARSAGIANNRTGEGWRRLLSSDHFPVIILGVLTAIVVGSVWSISPYFLSPYNIGNVLGFLAILAFISIGQMLTILVGRIDLSVGALAGFVVVLASFLTPRDAGTIEVIGGTVLILLCAAGYGFVQGWLVTTLRLPAIIITLASFIGLQGLSLALRPQAAGSISRAVAEVSRFPLIGIPAGMILALLVAIGLEWILYRRPIGRRFRTVGSSPQASHNLGIDSNRIILLAFVLSGLLTGIGGMMLAGQVGIGSPLTGVDFTIMSITAVVLGGASVSGGRASVLATLMGAALVQTISSASSFINSDSSIRLIVLGSVTLLAATFFSIARRRDGVVH